MKLILLAIAVVALLAWLGRARRSTMSLAEARATLELTGGADAETVRSAHRRVIARVHPDAGGSTELAKRATAARDVLLKDLDRRSRS